MFSVHKKTPEKVAFVKMISPVWKMFSLSSITVTD